MGKGCGDGGDVPYASAILPCGVQLSYEAMRGALARSCENWEFNHEKYEHPSPCINFDNVGAAPGAPRPRTTIKQHPTLPFSTFHHYSLVESRPRSEWPLKSKRNHPAP